VKLLVQMGAGSLDLAALTAENSGHDSVRQILVNARANARTNARMDAAHDRNELRLPIQPNEKIWFDVDKYLLAGPYANGYLAYRFCYACMHDPLENVQNLVRGGTNPHFDDHRPLAVAVSCGRTAVVKYLQEVGGMSDHARRGAVLAATAWGHLDILAYLLPMVAPATCAVTDDSDESDDSRPAPRYTAWDHLLLIDVAEGRGHDACARFLREYFSNIDYGF
jgi:hypothetical protein